MNVNGPPIVRAARRSLNWPHRLPKTIPDLIALHDELELPPGQLDVRPRGSMKGHRGLQSLSESLGTRDFTRFRLGIGRPADRNAIAVSKYVLGAVSKAQHDMVSFDTESQAGGALLEKAWDHIHHIAHQQMEMSHPSPSSPNQLSSSQHPA